MELTSYLVSEIAAIFIQITAIGLNGAIICTLCKKSLFRCPSNKFVFSLCLSQLLLSILSFLISISQTFTSRSSNIRSGGQFGRAITSNDPLTPIDPADSMEFLASSPTTFRTYFLSHCQLYAAFIVAVGGSLTIGLISIDRYITISLPMKYKSIVTPGRTTFAISLCWLVSVLITLLPPLFIFGNETFVYGPIAIPKGALGLYFAIVFTLVTTLVLSVMIRCYNRIFKIAKEKCQKVQIGHFTSPVSSISSDWPSSAYCSSHPALDKTRVDLGLPGTGGQRGQPQRASAQSNSLLQYVLLANLGKQGQPTAEVEKEASREPFITTYPEPRPKAMLLLTLPPYPRSLTPKRHRALGPKSAANLLRQGTRKWRTFLQHNYNSPRKTVSTILTLIGSLTLTQLPITIALFTATVFPTLFHFCFKIFLGIGAISSPILYGFLNRTIRVYLWKFLRIRRTHPVGNANHWNCIDSRKASISSGISQVFQPGLTSFRRESQPEEVKCQPEVKSDHEEIERKITCDKVPLCSIVIEAEPESNSSGQSSSFPRKPSQDSGADVSFTDDEDEVEQALPLEAAPVAMVTTVRARAPGSGSPGIKSDSTRMVMAWSLDRADFPYVDSDDDVDIEEAVSDDDLSEPDDLFDYDDDDVTFERMKDIIKKKFSLTEEDLGTVMATSEDDDDDDGISNLRNQPIQAKVIRAITKKYLHQPKSANMRKWLDNEILETASLQKKDRQNKP